MNVIALFMIVASCGLQRKLHKPPYLGARQMECFDLQLAEQVSANR
jgi:hypothetical protein